MDHHYQHHRLAGLPLSGEHEDWAILVSSMMSNIYVLLVNTKILQWLRSNNFIYQAAVFLSSVICDLNQGEGRHQHHHHRHHTAPVSARRQHIPFLHQVLPFLAHNRAKHQQPK